MSIRITAVHLEGGTSHQHIASLRWLKGNSETGESTRASIVQWLDSSSANIAEVGIGSNAVRVHVVRPQYGSPYVQTQADGKWSNNLLSLPRY